MTDAQRSRFVTDLTRMSGGEKPTDVNVFSDGWSAYFKSEIAALRVSNHYHKARRVKYAPHADVWICGV